MIYTFAVLNLDPELIYDSSTFRDGEISWFQINFQNINEDDYDYTITWSLTGEVTEDFTFVNRNFFEYNWIRSGTYNHHYDIAIPLMNTEYAVQNSKLRKFLNCGNFQNN